MGPPCIFRSTTFCLNRLSTTDWLAVVRVMEAAHSHGWDHTVVLDGNNLSSLVAHSHPERYSEPEYGEREWEDPQKRWLEINARRWMVEGWQRQKCKEHTQSTEGVHYIFIYNIQYTIQCPYASCAGDSYGRSSGPVYLCIRYVHPMGDLWLMWLCLRETDSDVGPSIRYPCRHGPFKRTRHKHLSQHLITESPHPSG